MCLLWGLARVLRVSGGSAVHLSRQRRKHLGRYPNPLGPTGKAHPKQDFICSEVRIRDGDIPTTHIAVPIKGVSRSSPEYYPMFVMQPIFVHSALHQVAPILASLGHHCETQPRQLVHALLDLLL
jgi:Peptidase M16 inactive domain